jgi:CDP-diacylglycerol--glycerol-3-phosphate 3-phosphatidyltransferase
VPFFIVQLLYYVNGSGELHRILALVAFAIAAVSDGIDGFIARRFDQRSELGAILDPLADKLLLVSGVVLLSFRHEDYLAQLPLSLTATVLSRDILLLLGLVVIRYVGGKVAVRPHLTGKFATVLQMTCVLWALLKWDAHLLEIWSIGATWFTGISGIIYVVEGVRQLSATPASSASRPKSDR